MTTQPKTSSKLLIPIALLAMLAAGVAVTSPRTAAVPSGQVESKPADSQQDGIRARQLIFHSDDLREVPEEWERAWELEMPDVTTPYRVHGGVI
jgi:hypothetical protein